MRSPLRALDPRARLVVAAGLVISAFLVTSLPAVVALLTATLLVGVIGRVHGKLLKLLKIFGPMVAVAFILWATMSSYSLIYQSAASGVSFELGAFMALRLLILISAPFIFIATTTPSEVVSALESLKLPRSAIFLLSLALRHISSVSYEYQAIKEAQTSRGLELDRGFLLKRIRNYIPVIIPLLVKSIEMADRISPAMELKLFNLKSSRSRFFHHRLKTIDYVVIAATISALAAILAIRWLAGGV